MDIAIGAARWVVGRALGPVTDGVLEAWAASSQLGPNIHALKLELLYAQGMLTSAHGRNVHNPALAQLLLELRHLAYIADDVLDELDYFRIQDALEETYEAIDDAKEEQGLARGLVLHARHTTRAITGKLTCSCAASESRADEQEVEGKQGRFLSAAAHAVGKHLSCCSLPSVHDDASGSMPTNGRCFLCGAWSSKAQQRKHAVHEAKLKFDRVEMSNKMTDIVEQLKPVCAKVATILGLESLGYSNSAKTQGTDLEQRPKTTPEIIEPELYRRQNQKQKVADDVINEYCVHDLTVLPIVGPGGIGKTTFTQHIYDKVKSHFPVTAWICVSQNFNANKLAQEIVNKLPKSNDETETDNNQERIEKRIRSKQFLLVLDDMWTYYEDEWKTLLAPFKKGGTKGNMVIVTTRIPKVAKMVELMSCSIKVERLQDEDSMELFQACVGIKTWKDYPSDLKDVGTNIVKRLKGFPLAVKTVGRLLRNQLSLDRWTTVLESKEWELQGNEDDIMPALKLSYNYLPFQLQQCFSCCALFPEDYRFGRQELINFWIGLGLLGAGDQKKNVEDIGLGYLDDLVENGFFEQDGKDHDNCYVIHDLLHELATNVSSYESLRLNGSDVRSIHIPTSIRHMSVIIDNTHVKDRMIFENHKKDLSSLGKKLKAGNLHTIMLFGECHGSFYKIFGDILRDAKSLRVIFLSGASYNIKDLLHNFSKLVHLRYLRIKDSSIFQASLPNSITRFYHLLVLDLQEHWGELGFLRDMGNLLKLRHFLVHDDNIHSRIFEVAKLNFLHELRKFEVKREMKGFDLEQIGQLLELRGSLGIYNLEKVEVIKEADDAKLAYLNHLDRLVLNWDNSPCNKDPVREGNVLERLKPHNNIRELHVAGHGGATCPNWLGGDFSIRNLESLHVESVNWDILPLPGKLYMTEGQERQGCVTSHDFHYLKILELVNIPKLKKWHGDGTCLLPHLQNLTVSDCPELMELPLSQSTSCRFQQSVVCFPKLQEIMTSKCPKLLSFPPIPWTNSLCHAYIEGVDSGFEKLNYSKDEQSKTTLNIMGKDAPGSMFWNVLDFNSLTELEVLEIINCPPISLDHLKTLTCLKTLQITDLGSILLPVGGENYVQYKLSVEILDINSCTASGRELTRVLSHLPKLSNLTIRNCQNVAGVGVAEQRTITTPESSLSPPANEAARTPTTRPQQQTGEAEEMEAAADDGLLLLPSQIKELGVFSCQVQRLLSLCSSSSFPISLQALFLVEVEGIETLPPLPPNLTKLWISDCGNLRGGEVLWDLLAQGHLTELVVYNTPNFFLGSEHSCSQVDKQEDVHRSWRLQELRTDDFARILVAPVCHLLSSSLTKLALRWNGEVECFTKEQEEALHILTSIEDLKFSFCEKLQFLPAGLSQIPTIKTLWIDSCRAITSLGSLPISLQELRISGCPAITSLGSLPISLQQLEIEGCPAIHLLPKDGLPTSLREIDVRDCGNEELKSQCRKLQGTIPIVWV